MATLTPSERDARIASLLEFSRKTGADFTSRAMNLNQNVTPGDSTTLRHIETLTALAAILSSLHTNAQILTLLLGDHQCQCDHLRTPPSA